MQVIQDAVFNKEAAMQSARHQSRPDIEFSIGPHVARPDWRVLRVTFVRSPEHEHRVAEALKVLVAPDLVEEPPSGADGDGLEKVRHDLAPA